MPQLDIRYIRLACDLRDCTKTIEYPVDQRLPAPWVRLEPPKFWLDLIPDGTRSGKAVLYFHDPDHYHAWVKANIKGAVGTGATSDPIPLEAGPVTTKPSST